MKTITLTAALLAYSASFATADTFANGNFENGSLSGWRQGAGVLTSSQTDNLNPGAYLLGGASYDNSYNANGVVSPGFDANTDNNLRTVYAGNYSARVNNNNPDNSVSVLSQTVQNYSDPTISFAWAAVLESSHGATDSDIFQIRLTDDTTGTELYNVTYNSATAPAGLFKTSSTDWNYTDWQLASLDVSGRVGNTFTLTLLGSDCPYGGHAGYVYLDGFGGTVPPPGDDPAATPEPATMSLMGASLIGITCLIRKRRAGK